MKDSVELVRNRAQHIATVCAELLDEVQSVNGWWEEAVSKLESDPQNALRAMADMEVRLETIIPIQLKELLNNLDDVTNAMNLEIPGDPDV